MRRLSQIERPQTGNAGSSLPPPSQRKSVPTWLKDNLFTNWRQSLFTVVLVILVGLLVYNVLHWVFVTADWAVIPPNFKLLLSGQYPVDELWRIW